MKTKTIAIVAIFSTALATLLLLRVFGDSASRIRREHGLNLPASASAIECHGDAWLRIITDCGAASSFEVAISDVPSLLAQLRVRSTSTGVSESIFPGNPEYQVHRSWMSGIPTATYRCNSPTGDDLSVQTWPIDSSRVGICLYTDWN
jgi:hypothetical protein